MIIVLFRIPKGVKGKKEKEKKGLDGMIFNVFVLQIYKDIDIFSKKITKLLSPLYLFPH